MRTLRSLVLVIFAAHAPTAASAELPARVVTEGVKHLAVGDANTVVYTATWTGDDPVTRTDDGRQRQLPPLPGCRYATAGGGRLAYDCGSDVIGATAVVRHLATASLAGDDVVSVQVPPRRIGHDGAMLGATAARRAR